MLSASPTPVSLSHAPAEVLYNFKLLEALRSDDPAQVMPFLAELKAGASAAENQQDAAKAGRLLGMAVKVASGKFNLFCILKIMR
jgi:hypothetical protein